MKGERINGVQIIECTDDEIVMRATTLLNSESEKHGIVIWHDGRLIVRIPWRDTAS
jgi:hypothetical protein